METPVVNEANASCSHYAAACRRCGGWTDFGGMKSYADGPLGCICHNAKARVALRQLRSQLREWRMNLTPLADS